VTLLPDYLKDYATPREATQQLGRFFVHYNAQRQHQALGYQTPATVYFGAEAEQSL
jgi:putative transposase